MKIFIIESPSPNDLLNDQNEKDSLEKMCKMFGHECASFTSYSKVDLEKIVEFLAKIKLDVKEYLCIHFSCHGSKSGIRIGGDFIDWKEFTKILIPIFIDNKIGNQTIISISACHAKEQIVTSIINKVVEKYTGSVSPPIYFFVINESKVLWDDALLSWSILYHQIGKHKDLKREKIQSIIKRIKNGNFGDILYFRWDIARKLYLRFKPKN